MAQVLIIPLIPKDMDDIARQLGMDKTLEPGEGYTLTTCDECGCACWIGPRQLEKYQTTPGPIALLCYMCVVHKGGTFGMIDLGNPNSAKEKPL